MRVSLTLRSSNGKTGPIPVSTTSAASCPSVCPFKSSGCYADGGPLAIHWREITNGCRGTDWNTFCDQIAALPAGQLWRHNQAGDLPRIGAKIDKRKLIGLVKANRGRRGFTYTHHDMGVEVNRNLVRFANQAGFAINLSGNNLAHADRLADYQIGPVTVVLPADVTENCRTPAGRRVVICPAVQRDNVSCATCKLCARADRETIIGFPAHGSGKRKATVIALRQVN